MLRLNSRFLTLLIKYLIFLYILIFEYSSPNRDKMDLFAILVGIDVEPIKEQWRYYFKVCINYPVVPAWPAWFSCGVSFQYHGSLSRIPILRSASEFVRWSVRHHL